MRRSLILLLTLSVLSVGILAAAVPYVNRNAEAVTYTEQRLYGDPAESADAARGWSVEAARLFYLANASSDSVVTAESSGEQYVSRSASLARGHALYLVGVTGAPNLESRVVETLESVLSEFEGL